MVKKGEVMARIPFCSPCEYSFEYSKKTSLWRVLPFAALLSGATAIAAQAASVTARSADKFVDSMGIATHYQNTDGLYSNFDVNIKGRLQELGVRYVRTDTATSTFNRATLIARARSLGQVGIKSYLIVESRKSNGVYNTDTHTPQEVVQLLKDIGPQFCVVEGPNEPEHSNDAWRFFYNGYEWPNLQGIHDFTRDVYHAVKSDPATASVPVLPASMLSNGAQIGDLSTHLDFGNLHTYPTGEPPVGLFFGDNLNNARQISGSKPMVCTETGYTTAQNPNGTGFKGVPDDVQAKYLARVYFGFWNRGLTRTFVYQLLNPTTGSPTDIQAHYGIIRGDGVPKPAFNTIKNIISILKEATFNSSTQSWNAPSFSPGNLDYSLVGDTTNIETTLLQKSNGKFYLALWQNAESYAIWRDEYNMDCASGNCGFDSYRVNVPARRLGIVINGSRVTARQFTPLNGTGATSLTVSGNRVDVDVPDHPILIELSPVPANRRISMRAVANNRYVSAPNGGLSSLIASANAVGVSEQFDVLEQGNGVVALRAVVNGKLVCAENGGTAPLIANRAVIGLYEQFSWISNADGTLSLLAHANSRYVCADNNGAAPLIANRTAIGAWEKFWWSVAP
jgi:hypothetical protein